MVTEGHRERRHRAQVVHHVPGRMRFKVLSAKGNHPLLGQICESASRLAGVRRVDVSPITGSVVIEYRAADPSAFISRMKEFSESSGLLSFVLPEFGEAERAVATTEAGTESLTKHSEMYRSILDLLTGLNLEVKRATNNAVDLKLLVPLGLAAYSLFFVNTKESSPLWVTLLVFSIHTFVSLHQAVPQPAGEAVES
jgi:hypothetical protein